MRTRRRDRDERGAALVEFALVFPALFLIVSGIIDFGMVLASVNSMRQGVREGARQAVVANYGANTSCSLTGVGAAPSSVQALMCLTKDRIGLGDTSARVRVRLPGSNEVGNSIVVYAMYPMRSMTGVFSVAFGNKAIKSRVEMRIEKVDPTFATASETPLDGTDWTWCS